MGYTDDEDHRSFLFTKGRNMSKILKKSISLITMFAIILTMLPTAFTAFAAEVKPAIPSASIIMTTKRR